MAKRDRCHLGHPRRDHQYHVRASPRLRSCPQVHKSLAIPPTAHSPITLSPPTRTTPTSPPNLSITVVRLSRLSLKVQCGAVNLLDTRCRVALPVAMELPINGLRRCLPTWRLLLRQHRYHHQRLPARIPNTTHTRPHVSRLTGQASTGVYHSYLLYPRSIHHRP